jgi:hypothetical protein
MSDSLQGASPWWFTHAGFVVPLGSKAVGQLLRSCIVSVRRCPLHAVPQAVSSLVTSLHAKLGGFIDLEAEEEKNRIAFCVLVKGPFYKFSRPWLYSLWGGGVA